MPLKEFIRYGGSVHTLHPFLDGYAVYYGNMRAEGLRGYLTSTTPFKHTLTIK